MNILHENRPTCISECIFSISDYKFTRAKNISNAEKNDTHTFITNYLFLQVLQCFQDDQTKTVTLCLRSLTCIYTNQQRSSEHMLEGSLSFLFLIIIIQSFCPQEFTGLYKYIILQKSSNTFLIYLNIYLKYLSQ